MPKSLRSYALLFLFMFLVIVPAQAQQTPDVPEPFPADVETIDGVMAAVYDVISGGAGVERDWDRFRSLFRPEAQLAFGGCNPNNGNCGMRFMSVEDYISGPGQQITQIGFFEKEVHRLEERYGNISHNFSTYESRRTLEDEKPFTGGINSFQLFNDGNRWWVVNIFWQSIESGGPIPAKYGG